MNQSYGRIVIALMALAVPVCAAAAKSEINQGLDMHIRDEAIARDAGLPAYPRSRPYKEGNESSSGANIGFSVPGFGLKVVAAKYESGDDPERVAAFYRRVLAKYGAVLDCSDARENKRKLARDDDDLACDAHDPGDNALVYKVGTESNQRIVAIKPHGNGTRFSVVHVEKREK